MVARIFVHHLIEGCGSHAGMDLTRDHVQNTGIDDTALADAINLVFIKYQVIGWHQATAILVGQNLLVQFRQRLAIGNLPILFYSFKYHAITFRKHPHVVEPYPELPYLKQQ